MEEEELGDNEKIEVSDVIDINENDVESDKGKEEIKDSTHKKKEAAKKRHKEINARNGKIISNTIALLQCKDTNELSELVLSALSALDNIERGSLSDAKKVKLFLGRWHEKSKMIKNEETKLAIKKLQSEDEELFLERDRIIATSFDIVVSNNDKKERIKKTVEM